MNDREKLFNLLDSAISESKKFCKEQEKCESCRYIEFGAKCQEMAQVDYLIANGVNLASVVHGRWEMISDYYARCPNCRTMFEVRPAPMVFKANNRYCRNCGAKMDGGVSDG